MKKNHDPVSTQKDVEMIRRVIELADESIKNGEGLWCSNNHGRQNNI